MEWLKAEEIPFDVASMKKDLLSLCLAHKKVVPCEIDALCATTGHKILKSPPYCYFYNPIELVWGICKRYYDAHVALKCDYSEKMAVEVWNEALAQVTPKTWSKCVDTIERKILEDYRRFYKENFQVQLTDNASPNDDNRHSDDSDMETVSNNEIEDIQIDYSQS